MNGLNGKNPSHLGCRWGGVYSDRQNAFGIFAWDTMVGYANLVTIHGLDLGAGVWPDDNPPNTNSGSTAYVVGQTFTTNLPITWGKAGTPSTPRQGGVWSVSDSPFAIEPLIQAMDCHGWPSSSGKVFYTLTSASIQPGVNPTTSSPFIQVGNPNCAFIQPTLPFTVIAFYVDAFNRSGFATNVWETIGDRWTNNVVLNGGALPGSTSYNAINVWYDAMITAGLATDGTFSSCTIRSANAVAPDSLIAALTPCIDLAGSQPWVNHNFVGGDLTINGLAGDAATKYLDTGINPSTSFFANNASMILYGYTVTSTSGGDFGNFNVGAGDCYLDLDQSGNSIGAIATSTANRISVANPGQGYFSISRNSSTAENLYFANSITPHASIGNETVANANAYTSLNLFLGAINVSGSPAVFSNNRYSFCAVGRKLTPTQDTAVFNAVQSLRTSLGGGFR